MEELNLNHLEESRFAGIDIGAETIKYVVISGGKQPKIVASGLFAHEKSIETCLQRVFEKLAELKVTEMALCGRYANHMSIRHYPARAVLKRGLTHIYADLKLTYVSIGCNGFCVFERRGGQLDMLRENSRCSQGTGNFLRQLVERFNLDLPKSDAMCENVTNASSLSGRCPVILKTDMTHLANRGDKSEEILAGVYDAICENVQALIKPTICPKSVILAGGVARSARIRKNFEQFCEKNGLQLLETNDLAQFYVDALGSALLAKERGGDSFEASKYLNADLSNVIAQCCEDTKTYNCDCTETNAEISDAKGSVKRSFLKKKRASQFDVIPALRQYLKDVVYLPQKTFLELNEETPVIIGFDIGSTGSKAVAIALTSIDKGLDDCVWEAYTRTSGNPVAAAQELVKKCIKAIGNKARVVGFGVTGSGREIVGSMLSTCYGAKRVFVINEIAAHAEGARVIEPRVDTIFEIGGQDAKYIRLAEGRIVDAAMNEACSAGTGSFIEEQGKKFGNIENLSMLSDLALAGKRCISLGQHCSVFMSQVIEEAVASGIEREAIIAGIYDSVVLNYFFRVKGNRSVGDVVFCQGMPFSSPALAAAVARQTKAKVIIPPNPGTIGAFGIARLSRESLAHTSSLINLLNKKGDKQNAPIDLTRFLEAELLDRHSFACGSNKGCGGSGNRCKIDKIIVRIDDTQLQFTWGGACSMWDKAITAVKLPDLAPDPFRERTAATDAALAKMPPRSRKTVAISDEFQTKTFFVFFATLLYELGYDLLVFKGGTLADLKRGLDGSNVLFCAPMQHFHGVAAKMAESKADLVFLPMMRSGNFSADEEYAGICPVVQASPDLIYHDLNMATERVLTPVIDLGPGNLDSKEFIGSCQKLAESLKAKTSVFEQAFKQARASQIRFDTELKAVGRRALAFAKTNNIPAVVVLGRNYTIHNNALNSNVPTLLRTQGAMAIPVDCYPIESDVPVYSNIYWSYGQLNLRAATQIRGQAGEFALWCSNYGCGPDSFNLHFFQYIMQGKPYTVIETDGHSGDAGTKTRIEAYLHCIREYGIDTEKPRLTNLLELENRNMPLIAAKKEKAIILIPPMGDNAEMVAAGFRGIGIESQVLPVPTRATLHIGRRQSSGKECLPLQITLGSLLEFLEHAPTDRSYVYFMPRSNGPCRLGCYNLLDKIVLERLGYSHRIHTWSPSDTDYTVGIPMTTAIMILTSFIACDTLMAALYDCRPVESRQGAANAIYQRHYKRLIKLLEAPPKPRLWQPFVAKEVLSGNFFGFSDIVKSAAREFAEIKTHKKVPTVCVTGEIYVRNDPFANNYMIDALEARGLRVLFAHFSEWIEYADIINREILKTATSLKDIATSNFLRHIFSTLYNPMARALAWPKRHDVHDILNVASDYLRTELVGEEILSIGTPLHAYLNGEIQGVVNVGPLECMPSKIAESQFFHVAEREGLLSISLTFNGDPLPDSALDDFAFEVKKRFEEEQKAERKLA